jgi:hypothetical protein
MNTRTLAGLLWSAFFAAVLIYHALIISRILPTEDTGVGEILGYVLLVCGIVVLLVVIGFDLFLVSRPRRIHVSADLLPEGTGPLDEEEVARQAKAAYFLRLTIIAFALAEAPGILGLVLYLLGGSIVIVHTLVGLAYLCLLYISLRMATIWEKRYLG